MGDGEGDSIFYNIFVFYFLLTFPFTLEFLLKFLLIKKTLFLIWEFEISVLNVTPFFSKEFKPL